MNNRKEELKKYINSNLHQKEGKHFNYLAKFKIFFENDDEDDEEVFYFDRKNEEEQIEEPQEERKEAEFFKGKDIHYSLTSSDNMIDQSIQKKRIYDWAEEEEHKQETKNIDNFIKQHKEYTNFQKTLFKLIDERNLKDSDVYNKVHLDRRTFAKIKNEEYHPSKETVILLAISLELTEKELEDLLDSASYSLPKNNYYDLIIRFCFINEIYKISEINELLEEYNCKLFNY